jgi:hypothetical protein
MQGVSQGQLDIAFPKKYLQKFAEHKKRSTQFSLKPKRRETSSSPQVFSSHCKQAISMARTKVYCCVLKELVQGVMCKACPCHEPEPLEYALFKRE